MFWAQDENIVLFKSYQIPAHNPREVHRLVANYYGLIRVVPICEVVNIHEWKFWRRRSIDSFQLMMKVIMKTMKRACIDILVHERFLTLKASFASFNWEGDSEAKCCCTLKHAVLRNQYFIDRLTIYNVMVIWRTTLLTNTTMLSHLIRGRKIICTELSFVHVSWIRLAQSNVFVAFSEYERVVYLIGRPIMGVHKVNNFITAHHVV